MTDSEGGSGVLNPIFESFIDFVQNWGKYEQITISVDTPSPFPKTKAYE